MTMVTVRGHPTAEASRTHYGSGPGPTDPPVPARPLLGFGAGVLAQRGRPRRMGIDPSGRGHCAGEPRAPVPAERLAPRHLRCPRPPRCRRGAGPGRGVRPPDRRDRGGGRGGHLRQDDATAPVAGVAERARAGSVAHQRPLLPAESRARRSQQPGISRGRRSAAERRCPGRLRGRHLLGGHVRHRLHRRAVVHRRRAHDPDRRHDAPYPRLPGGRGLRLCPARQRIHDPVRPRLHPGVREQEPGGGELPLRAHPPPGKRREHRLAGWGSGRARRSRRGIHDRPHTVEGPDVAVHPHHDRVHGQQRPRAHHPDPPLCAQVRRGDHESRSGHAGRVRLHDRADRLQLAGRELSPSRRLGRLGLPIGLAPGVAGSPGAGGARRAPTAASSAVAPRAGCSACGTCRSRWTMAARW